MRRAVLLCLIVVLAGCKKPGGAPALFTEPRLPPGVESRFWAPDGWAWGLLKVGDRPALRYGVSASPAIPLADVVIMPGYGESAEMWFETARALNDADYNVWVMDGAGQGGSQRYGAPHDLGHLTDVQDDVLAIEALVRKIVRPPAKRPVAVIASGTAWLPAQLALQKGFPAVALIESGPDEPPRPAASQSKTARANGASAWSRPNLANLPRRQRAAKAWAIANPDLRMGGPSWGWHLARQKGLEALNRDAVGRNGAQILIISPIGDQTQCAGLPRCAAHRLASEVPYHLAPDADRDPWLEVLIGSLPRDHVP